jgi:hypothetical protein
MKLVPLLMVLPLLGACDVHSKGDSGDDNVSINGDANGNISFNLPFAKGTVKLPGDAMRSGDFDIDGVKMIPDGHITSFNVNSVGRGSVVRIAFDAPRAPDQVRSYFLDQFKQKGVEASASGDSVSGRSKDGSDFVINVQAAGSGSQGTIDVHSKD